MSDIDSDVRERALAGNTEEEENIVRAKWAMDGAKTLSEAASMLRERADHLELLERDGWQLTDAVNDDYGFISR